MTETTRKGKKKKPGQRAAGRMLPAHERPYLTSGVIAELVGCAARTVSKWIDAEVMPGAFRLPEGNTGKTTGRNCERRVPRDTFIRFLRDRGMRHALLKLDPNEGRNEIWTFDVSSGLTEKLRDDGFTVWCVPDVFSLVVRLVDELPPAVLVLDASLGRQGVRAAARRVPEVVAARYPHRKPPLVIVLHPADAFNPDPELPPAVAQITPDALPPLVRTHLVNPGVDCEKR